MDERGVDVDFLTDRIEKLQHERDALRKDIEQLCLQQAGPSYLAVATRMHFQRTAALEQEIDSLKRRLSGLAREKQNLQEELSEAYRIKAQLADLHGAELLKNKEAEKQIKFFQSCVAAAFAERDHSLMESEKAKEHEEVVLQKLVDYENRFEELQSACNSEKKLNASLEMELHELQGQNKSYEKVIDKFCEIRERDTGWSAGETWQNKCLCLLDDPSEKWIFNSDSITSTTKYIASLEKEVETLKSKINNLQTNMRMGLEIEQLLKRNVHSLEKKQIIFNDKFRRGLLRLRDFHSQQRSEVMSILEEEKSKMNSVLVEVHRTMSQIHKTAGKSEAAQREYSDTEYRDVHISVDVESPLSKRPMQRPSSLAIENEDYKSDDRSNMKKFKSEAGHSLTSTGTSRTNDVSDALAQALQEKVATLLLLSQQEERHLLYRNVNAALERKIAELQNNLSQVTNEKVKILLELAQLKKEYHLLLDSGMQHTNLLAAGSDKSISVHETEGKLKNMLRKSYLSRWMGKDLGKHEPEFHGNTDDSTQTGRKNCSSMEFARLKVENAALQESMANMEHLTSSIHKLRISLLKVQENIMSAIAAESKIEAISSITQEANHVKTALGSCLPVSWYGEVTDAISCSLHGPTEEASESEKVDPVSAAGFEMVELLILAAQLLKDHLTGKTAGSQIL